MNSTQQHKQHILAGAHLLSLGADLALVREERVSRVRWSLRLNVRALSWGWSWSWLIRG